MKKKIKLKKINRKKRIGLVIRKKQPSTLVVKIQWLRQHPYYHKRYKVDRHLAVNDEKDIAKVGDKVEIEECRPISKTKRWRVVEVIKN